MTCTMGSNGNVDLLGLLLWAALQNGGSAYGLARAG